MDPVHRNIIQQNEKELASLINFDALEPHLVPFDLFTKAMVDDFKSFSDEERRAALIKDLPTRGPDAFSTFGKILINTNQIQAAELLGFSRSNGRIINRYTTPRGSPYQNKLGNDGDSGRPNASNTIQETVQVFTGPQIYKMTSSPRGLCLLINNYDFSNSGGYSNREGTVKDGQEIKAVFEQLDFLVDQHDDLTAERMMEVLHEFSQRDAHKGMDAAVIFMLSHGHKETIVGIDGKEIPIKSIVTEFNNQNCTVLHGKPKLFFIQACRGVLTDYGAYGTLTTDAAVNQSLQRITVLTDILISYSCNEDYVSYRDENDGGWYIMSLLGAIRELAHNTEINEILNEMERRIQALMGPEGELTSTESRKHGFRKSLYFNPGYSDS